LLLVSEVGAGQMWLGSHINRIQDDLDLRALQLRSKA
jgi:hypothetical protein